MRIFSALPFHKTWLLHLETTLKMLPYFAASGHNNYLKSSYIYEQQMYDLIKINPDIHQHILRGLFVVHRSDREWGGIPTDQIIEQCLMRNLKTSGGLTHGRGLTEQQRNIWTLSMPVCAEVNQSTQKIAKTPSCSPKGLTCRLILEKYHSEGMLGA